MIFYWARFRMRSKRYYIVVPMFATSMMDAVQMAEELRLARMPKAYLVGIGIDA